MEMEMEVAVAVAKSMIVAPVAVAKSMIVAPVAATATIIAAVAASMIETVVAVAMMIMVTMARAAEGRAAEEEKGGLRFNVRFQPWTKGAVLGSGSYGTVYEGFGYDGSFFAVKEVSLVDQGSKAKESISQLEKGSLASLYQKYNLTDSQVHAYTRQILTGLKYLHERNVIHRDIKCANKLVDAKGLLKLADFGLAKETSNLDELKSFKGSAYWMALEVVNPQNGYGLSADIWSLGCTVTEMLTQRHPYGDLEWQQALYKIGRGELPPFPSKLSRDAKDFIQLCLRVEPADRPSASELLNHPFVK